MGVFYFVTGYLFLTFSLNKAAGYILLDDYIPWEIQEESPNDDAQQLLSTLCERYILTLNNERIDCSKVQLYDHLIRKREAEPDLFEGSGNGEPENDNALQEPQEESNQGSQIAVSSSANAAPVSNNTDLNKPQGETEERPSVDGETNVESSNGEPVQSNAAESEKHLDEELKSTDNEKTEDAKEEPSSNTDSKKTDVAEENSQEKENEENAEANAENPPDNTNNEQDSIQEQKEEHDEAPVEERQDAESQDTNNDEEQKGKETETNNEEEAEKAVVELKSPNPTGNEQNVDIHEEDEQPQTVEEEGKKKTEEETPQTQEEAEKSNAGNEEPQEEKNVNEQDQVKNEQTTAEPPQETENEDKNVEDHKHEEIIAPELPAKTEADKDTQKEDSAGLPEPPPLRHDISTVSSESTAAPKKEAEGNEKDTDSDAKDPKTETEKVTNKNPKETEVIDEQQSGNAIQFQKSNVVDAVGAEGSGTEKQLAGQSKNAKANDANDAAPQSEQPNTGESTKNVGRAGKDTTILIALFVIVVVIGAAAFTHNFIKKRKQKAAEQKSLANGKRSNDVEQGTEGTEMKPLMKSNNSPVIVKEYTDKKQEPAETEQA